MQDGDLLQEVRAVGPHQYEAIFRRSDDQYAVVFTVDNIYDEKYPLITSEPKDFMSVSPYFTAREVLTTIKFLDAARTRAGAGSKPKSYKVVSEALYEVTFERARGADFRRTYQVGVGQSGIIVSAKNFAWAGSPSKSQELIEALIALCAARHGGRPG